MDTGRITTMIATLFLFGVVVVIGTLAQNPEYLQWFLCLPVYVKFGVLITAIFIAIYDFAYPRVKDALDTGLGLQFNMGSISTYLMTFTIIILTVIVDQPNLLQPILRENYGLFTLMGLPVLIAILNLIKPRTGQEYVNSTIIPVTDTVPEQDDDPGC